MDKLSIKKPHARTHAYSQEGHDVTKGLHIFQDSPERLFVGIYTTTEKQARYSSVTLTPEEARQVAAHLLQWAAEQEVRYAKTA